MSAGNVVVVVIGVVAVVAFVAWIVRRRRDPEDAAGHATGSRTGSALRHGDVSERPAGPGAEADGVAGRGQPTPGPSADAGPPREV